MSDEKESLTPEERAYNIKKEELILQNNELMRRQNMHLHWGQSVIWVSFWLGMFGYLTWG